VSAPILAVARGKVFVSELCGSEDMSLPFAQILISGRFTRFYPFTLVVRTFDMACYATSTLTRRIQEVSEYKKSI